MKSVHKPLIIARTPQKTSTLVAQRLTVYVHIQLLVNMEMESTVMLMHTIKLQQINITMVIDALRIQQTVLAVVYLTLTAYMTTVRL